MTPNGANRQQLTDELGTLNSLVTWSPDSQSIAYAHSEPDPGHPLVPEHTTIEVKNLITNHTFDLTGPFICPGQGLCFPVLCSNSH